MKAITQDEWNDLHDDYKLIRDDGTRYVLELVPEYGTCLVPAEIKGRYAVKCDECKREMRHTDSLAESAAGGTCDDCWTPYFSPWRHGGWYVDNLRLPSGAVGCVTRNFADKKWRIACDPRPGSFPGGPNDHTYPNRVAAARAERALARAQS